MISSESPHVAPRRPRAYPLCRSSTQVGMAPDKNPLANEATSRYKAILEEMGREALSSTVDDTLLRKEARQRKPIKVSDKRCPNPNASEMGIERATGTKPAANQAAYRNASGHEEESRRPLSTRSTMSPGVHEPHLALRHSRQEAILVQSRGRAPDENRSSSLAMCYRRVDAEKGRFVLTRLTRHEGHLRSCSKPHTLSEGSSNAKREAQDPLDHQRPPTPPRLPNRPARARVHAEQLLPRILNETARRWVGLASPAHTRHHMPPSNRVATACNIPRANSMSSPWRRR